MKTVKSNSFLTINCSEGKNILNINNLEEDISNRLNVEHQLMKLIMYIQKVILTVLILHMNFLEYNQ